MMPEMDGSAVVTSHRPFLCQPSVCLERTSGTSNSSQMRKTAS